MALKVALSSIIKPFTLFKRKKMRIQINNKTSIPNKHIRFIKWKIYRLQEKFKQLHYAEIFLRSEGNRPKVYQVNVRLGVTGSDIIIKNRSEDISQLLHRSTRDAQRYLAQRKIIQFDLQT